MTQDKSIPATDTTATAPTITGRSDAVAAAAKSMVRIASGGTVETATKAISALPQLSQLEALCRHLRATHRCPGECVLARSRQERLLRDMETLDVSPGEEG